MTENNIIKFEDIKRILKDKAKDRPELQLNVSEQKSKNTPDSFLKSIFNKYIFKVKRKEVIVSKIKIKPELDEDGEIWYHLFINGVCSHAFDTIEEAEDVAKILAIEYIIELEVKEGNGQEKGA